jgi:hypothetical protein
VATIAEHETSTAGSSATFSPVRTFLAVRRAWLVLTGTIVLGVLTAAVGTYEASLPTVGDSGQSVIPLWRLVTMGAPRCRCSPCGATWPTWSSR